MTTISKSTRDRIKDRANSRCEYCKKPRIVSIYGYHVDHIIPIKHGGDSNIENLAWACFECNISKGRDIASYDFDTSKLTRLYNPRTDTWDDHFDLNTDGFLDGITPIGRVTIRILELNHPDQINIRKTLVQMNLW